MSLSAHELSQFSVQLTNLHDDLRSQLASSDSASQPVELDQNRQGRLSRMDAMQGQAMAQAGVARLREQLVRLQEAQQRLRAGDFGRCLECDDWIAIARLKLNPSARHCIVCAASFE